MKCRICNCDDLKLYYTQGNEGQYKFYKCSNCKLVNYDLSTGQDQTKYTSEKYIHPRDENHKQNKDQAASYSFLKANVPTKGNLLDIGCGNGKILFEAISDGWSVKGLELSPFLGESIGKHLGIEVAIANFLDYIPLKDESYDVVILRHVLEHLPDSLGAMQKINRLMKQGGHGLMEFPDIESNEMKFKRLMERMGIHRKRYRSTYVPGHCNEFCRESFEFLLHRTGFELIKWENYSSKESLSGIYNLLHFGSKARALFRKI